MYAVYSLDFDFRLGNFCKIKTSWVLLEHGLATIDSHLEPFPTEKKTSGATKPL